MYGVIVKFYDNISSSTYSYISNSIVTNGVTNINSGVDAVSLGLYAYYLDGQVICFHESTLILTINEKEKEIYVPISMLFNHPELYKIKTYKGEALPISQIQRKKIIPNLNQ